MNEPANFGNGGLDGDGFGFSCEVSNINYPPYKVWSIFLIIYSIEDYRVLKSTANTFSTAIYLKVRQHINSSISSTSQDQSRRRRWTLGDEDLVSRCGQLRR